MSTHHRGNGSAQSHASFRKATLIVLLGVLAALAAACGSDPTATPVPTATATAVSEATATPTPAKAAWEVEWEELIAKGQEEGELVIVGGAATINFRPVFELFTEKFGISVASSGGSSSEIVNRILAERAAGRYTIDHFLAGTGTSSRTLIPNNVLMPILPQLILPEVLDESVWFQGRHWWADGDPEHEFLLAFAASAEQFDLDSRFNTDLVTEEDYNAVNSVWDYLDPRWKSRIVAQPPGRGIHVRAVYHPDVGPEFLERFFSPDLDVTFLTDARIIADQLATGGFALCVFCSTITQTLDQLGQWLAEGRLKYRVDVVDGVESAPTAVNKLFDGTNTGKLIVKVAEPSVAPSR